MIRVAVLDDHPAVLAGLRRLLEESDDFVAAATADTAEDLLRALNRGHADVALLDYDLSRSDGLAVCLRLKERIRPPGVVIYSAYAGPALVLAARIAGANAIVDKRAPVRELLGVVRRVAGGDSGFAEVPLELRETLLARLESDDIPVAGMLLAGTSHHGIAEALSTDRRDIASRALRILACLRPASIPYGVTRTVPSRSGTGCLSLPAAPAP